MTPNAQFPHKQNDEGEFKRQREPPAVRAPPEDEAQCADLPSRGRLDVKEQPELRVGERGLLFDAQLCGGLRRHTGPDDAAQCLTEGIVRHGWRVRRKESADHRVTHILGRAH